ncbi:MAG: biopolymer transporter ExbD [Candidatus Omnitrophica bacterium]|nr:biopolymer transporter ExbD [Candidatus Omnitrophota bacterium]
MKFRKHIKEEFGLRQFDIAPLIDIIFILLIFFMLTSSFMIQPGIRVDLPRTVTHQALQVKRVSITVSSEDVLYLGSKVVTDKELESYLLSNRENIKSVFIKADKNSSLGRVVEVWDLCRKANLSYVNIATTHVKE